MGKQAEIEPRWLVSLMCVWATHERASDNNHLGYPSKAAFLTIGRATVAYADPTGYCAQDFVELETALDALRIAHQGRFMAMMMYYKPWGVKACVADGWPFGNSTYYDRLHEGHRFVSTHINAARNADREREAEVCREVEYVAAER